MKSMIDLPNQPPIRLRDQKLINLENWDYISDEDE